MATQLETIAENERTLHVARNEYTDKNGYSSGHGNALSNGDEKGKGQIEDSGNVGGLTDINTRNDNVGRNKYKTTKAYPDFEY